MSNLALDVRPRLVKSTTCWHRFCEDGKHKTTHSKPSGHYIYIPPDATLKNSTFCPHIRFMCFVWISEQTAIISLYNINWLVFTVETEYVYCAVQTGPVNIVYIDSRHLKCSVGRQNARFTAYFKVYFKIPPRTQPSHRNHNVLIMLLSSTPFSPLLPTSSSPLPFCLFAFAFTDRAMVQAVSRRSSTAEARVRSQFSPCEICGGQSGTGQVFFPSISFFPCHYNHQFSTLFFFYMLEGQMVEALEPSIKQRCFGNRVAVDSKVLYL